LRAFFSLGARNSFRKALHHYGKSGKPNSLKKALWFLFASVISASSFNAPTRKINHSSPSRRNHGVASGFFFCLLSRQRRLFLASQNMTVTLTHKS